MKGFTLTELLVVMGILAVLAAMAVPALRSALDTADRTVCLSNLRQLGQAMNEYVFDHGHYPAAEQPVFGEAGKILERVRWYHALGPYLGTSPRSWSSAQGGSVPVLPSEDDRDPSAFSSVLQCPSVPHWTVGRNGSYGYNHQYLGDARVVGSSGDGEPVHRNYPVRRSQIQDRANTVVLMDSDGTGTERYVDPRNPDSRARGNHAFTVDPPSIPALAGPGAEPVRWASDALVPDTSPQSLSSSPSARHQGGCCVLFADGRASWLPLARLTESDAFWNGTGVSAP